VADAAVVGSAIVQTIADNLDDAGQPTTQLVDNVLDYARSLADGVRSGRQQAAE
jgi:tryptophan synthase alpha chain